MTPLTPASRIFVAGHRGLVGSAILRRLEAEGFRHVLTATRDQLDLRDQAAVELLVPGQPARVRVPRRRHRRRHHGQLHAAGGVHLRQHDDPRHGGARRAPVTASRSCSTSAARASTRAMSPQPMTEEYLLDRPARADQRGLRDREDRRHQAVPGLPHAVRLRLHLGDADQPLRPERQLRPDELARAAGADPQVPRREDAGQRDGDVWGTGAPRREFLHVDDLADALRLPDAPLRRRPRTSTSAPARTCTIRELAEMVRDDRPSRGAHRVRRHQARRHAAQAARRLASARARLDAPHRAAPTASRARIAGSSIIRPTPSSTHAASPSRASPRPRGARALTTAPAL